MLKKILFLVVSVCCNTASFADVPHNEFSFRLFKLVSGSGEERTSNFVYSPFSIGSLLLMVAEGSNGATRSQILDALGTQNSSNVYSSLSDGRMPRFKNANALWVDRHFSLRDSYQRVMRKKYGAQIQNADFAGSPSESRKQINGWIEDNTGGKIRELLQPEDISRGTAAVLVNAIYFAEKWKSAFDKSLSRKRPFRPDQGAPVTTDFMQMTGRNHFYEDENVRLIKIGYRSETASMVFLMPAQEKKIEHLVGQLTGKQFKQWLSQTKSLRVQLIVPKFEIKERIEVESALKAVGISNIFDGSADFSKMSNGRGISISNVLHEAYIKTDEEGTEAAAATAAVFTRGIPSSPIVRMTIDRPFLFFVVHEPTNAILFMGRYAKP